MENVIDWGTKERKILNGWKKKDAGLAVGSSRRKGKRRLIKFQVT